jgi:DNA uptake protein ComE-like DNA-binding protein
LPEAMKLKRIINDLFATTKAERNGAVVLSTILLILIGVRFLLPLFSQKDHKLEEINAMIQKIESMKLDEQESLTHINNFNQVTEKAALIREHIHAEYFNFDPNSVTADELIRMGISKNVAGTFVKFRSKGAVFKSPEDLLKVYGIDSLALERLRPYVIIKRSKEPDRELVPEKTVNREDGPVLNDVIETITKEVKLIDLNSADTTLLISLKGIGSVFARRIYNFRNILGGFVHVEQLKEVYNFPEETYQNIKDKVFVDTLRVTKIDINFASINDFKSHPYCNYALARSIVDYRAQNGSFTSVEQLLSDSVIPIDDYRRFHRYLEVSGE